MQLDLINDLPRLSIRPPFPYFGGKQKARRNIFRCFPQGIDLMVSPFLGGGSVELYTASRGIQVKAFDKFPPLCRLWQTLLRDAGAVAAMQRERYPYDPAFLKSIIQNGTNAMDIEDDVEASSIIWSMSHQAYAGMFMNSTYFDTKTKKTSKTVKACASIEYFNADRWDDWGNDNLTVGCQSWELTLEQYPDAFLYVDPPYVGNEKYYGQNKNKDFFDHVALAEALRNHNNGWVLSYVEHPIVDELYSDFEVLRPRWAQGIIAAQGKRDSKSAKELYILKPPAVNPLKSTFDLT